MSAETMEDAFAIFGIRRRPLIDEQALKQRYLRLAAERHPDAPGGNHEEFQLVQEAYKTLRDPTPRLRHLLELDFPAFRKDGGPVPHAELFLRAGNAVQAARTVWQRFEKTSSALDRALLSPEIAEALRQIREASGLVQEAEDELTRQLEELDTRWPDISPDEISALATAFRFVSRWRSQLSEWEFQLSSG
jgi:curved DNA-binding protein CbpA